jgi:hypothetical protein
MISSVRSVLLLLSCTYLPAQVVHVANLSDSSFDGWKRCTVDVIPAHAAGHVTNANGSCDYVLGRRVGEDTRIVDLRLHLDPWQVAEFDLSAASPWNFVRGPLPNDPGATFGTLSIGGEPLQLLSTVPDGGAWLSHARVRMGPMFCVDAWVWWWPDQPGWAQGEVVVTASNPTVTKLLDAVPADFRLQFGDAIVMVPGLTEGAPLLPAGTLFGDGQARSFPVVFAWERLCATPSALVSAWATSQWTIVANGLRRLWPDGNPQMVSGQSAMAWTSQHFAAARARLHTWDAGPLGVAASSGITGAQEDQVFVGAECMEMPAGLGAEAVRYFVALGQSRRPCHHLEADGSQLSLTAHPQLVMWDWRPHWNSVVSPDRLGKLATLNVSKTNGWWGADEEHLLLNTLSIAARLTGSPALQWQLSANARAFLYQKTVAPGLSTSRPGAARAVGWEGLAAVQLWTNLEDRVLAQRIADRWVARVNQIFLPQLGGKAAGIWDPREDPRLASTGWKVNWLPYQQSVGAWGLDYGCRILGPAQGRSLAYSAALAVLSRSFSATNGQWRGWGYLGYAGSSVVPLVEGSGAHYGAGIATWSNLAIATVLAHQPGNPTAMQIWAQLSANGGTWVPPNGL